MLSCKRSAVLLLAGLIPSVGLAGPLPKQFTIGQYLPSDVWMYIHHVRNPEREWLDEKWAEVFEAIEQSGVHKDLASLVMSAIGEQHRDDAQATLDKWSDLIQSVRWGDLIHEELAFAERLGRSKEMPAEYFLLMRGKQGTGEANIKALTQVLEELASLSEKVSITKRNQKGVDVWALGSCEKKAKAFPFSLQLFRQGDIIGVASGAQQASEMISLLAGGDPKRSVAGSPRLVGALRTVPAPEQGLLFFDFKALAKDITGMVDWIAKDIEKKAHGDPPKKEKGEFIVAAFKKAITLCDVMDYSIVTFEMDGRRDLIHDVTRFQKDKRKCSLACCLLDRKPFKRFDEFIPADATSFNISGLIDLEKLYKIVTDFVVDSVPGGEGYIAAWNGGLASVGFDPQRDLFSWWSGEMVSVTLPPAVVTPMSSADWVLMFRVKDAELASTKIGSGISFISEKLGGQGQGLTVMPAGPEANGFFQINHPMLMMAMVRPVFGVRDEWLMIASSAATIKRCLDVSKGEAPSIASNERFKKEGLSPKGPVLSCSFSDTSTFGRDLAQGAGMAGMVVAMVTASMPDSPESKKFKGIATKLGGMAMKLAPALAKIDFYSSEASVKTYDGSLTLRTERVITYKKPGEGDVKTAKAK